MKKVEKDLANESMELEHSGATVTPAEAVKPIFFLPTADDCMGIISVEDDPFMCAAREYMADNAQAHKFSNEAVMNSLANMCNQFFYNLRTSCNAIFIQDIVNTLLPFKHPFVDIQETVEDTSMFTVDMRNMIKEIIKYVFFDYLDNPMEPKIFIQGMVETKAFVTHLAASWINEYLNTVFIKNMVSAYGYSCFIASCTGLNVNDPMCPFNEATAYSFAMTSMLAVGNEAVHKMAEAAELCFVALFAAMREFVEFGGNNITITSSEFNN